jgi:aminoglycoside-2''-adenylyltransferase
MFPGLIDTMKRAAAALRDAEVPAMLGGGLAVWARGGPPTEHDVDFYLREVDAERGLAALAAAGMREERPPEGWLFKAHNDEVVVDLIFRPSGGPIADDHFDRAEQLEVMAQPMLVASLDDVLVTKLLSLREQELDFGPVLELSRSLREQVDWDVVRAWTSGSPFARAFFTLVEELGVAPAKPSTTRPASGLPHEAGRASNGAPAAVRPAET